MFKKISLCLMFLSLPISALAEGSGKSSKTNDQGEVLKLQSIFVGDREQPSVSYFIPWGEVAESRGFQWRVDRGKDNTLSIVDRSIHQRSLKIYEQSDVE